MASIKASGMQRSLRLVSRTNLRMTSTVRPFTTSSTSAADNTPFQAPTTPTPKSAPQKTSYTPSASASPRTPPPPPGGPVPNPATSLRDRSFGDLLTSLSDATPSKAAPRQMRTSSAEDLQSTLSGPSPRSFLSRPRGARTPRPETQAPPFSPISPTSRPSSYGNRSLLRADDPAHNLHVHCAKHNTHLVLTRPNNTPLVKVSCGMMGFRKAQRGLYDAAFQTSAEMMRRVSAMGLLGNSHVDRIERVNLIFRGFGGQGREAFQKVLLGTEGRHLRGRVVSVADATRLKIGGSRSPNPRRLG